MELIRDIKRKTEGLLQEGVGIKLYFVLKTAEGEKIKLANIADETLTDSEEDTTSEELLKGFYNAFFNKLEEYDEAEEILKLSSADERKNALYVYDLESVPEEMQRLKDVMQDNTEYELFQFAEDSLNEIMAFLIVIGNDKTKLALYRQQYPISLLTRDKFLLTPVPHMNRLTRVKKDILRVDFKFQFFSYT